MSFLWIDDASANTVRTTPPKERKAQQVSKTDPTNAIHPHHDNHQNDRHKAPSKSAHTPTAAYQANQQLPITANTISASQIMSRPVVTVPLETDVRKIWSMLQENYFRHLPVTTSNQQKIVGILSDRGINQALARAHMDGTEPAGIADIMQQPVLVATADTDIRHIAKIMTSQRIGAMPIVDEIQNLIGIISRSDILRTIVRNHDLTLWV